MIERSFDLTALQKGMNRCPLEMRDEEMDWQSWLNNQNNVMLVEDEDVGLATFEYPGLYTCHWMFKRKGREALELAKRMFDTMFKEHEAQALRGLTRIDLKAARWAARQAGMKSYGINSHKEGEHELFIITKDEFYGQT